MIANSLICVPFEFNLKTLNSNYCIQNIDSYICNTTRIHLPIDFSFQQLYSKR